MNSVPHIFAPEYYARLADIEEHHWWALGMRTIATRLLDRCAPKSRDWRVLDAGCGTGLTLDWVRRYTDIEPIGFDLARAALEYCTQRGHHDLLQATALMLPFQSDYFDLVISSDVLQHLPRPDGDVHALSEVVRVLKRGGLFLVRTNSQCGCPQSQDVDFQRYTLPEIRARVEQAGLRIRTATHANALPSLLESARRRLVTGNGSGGYTGLAVKPRPPETSLLTQILYRSLLAESAYLASGKHTLPFGHSIVLLAEKNNA
jgi:ubiquinone/menaquinone biosynthesis C-methylase UbiE